MVVYHLGSSEGDLIFSLPIEQHPADTEHAGVLQTPALVPVVTVIRAVVGIRVVVVGVVQVS